MKTSRLIIVLVGFLFVIAFVATPAYMRGEFFSIPAPPNSPPVANDDSYTKHGGGTIGPLLLNDFDPDGDYFTAQIVTYPTHGTLSGLNGSSFNYSLTPISYLGTDSFTYKACQTGGVICSNVATVTLTFVNQAPVGGNDSYPVHGTAIIGPLLANDSDPDGDQLSWSVLTFPAHGTVSGLSNPPYANDFKRYVAVNGYTGTDSFTYKVCDVPFNLCSAPVTVTLNISNNPPVPGPDMYVVASSGIIGPLFINDSDPEGDGFNGPDVVVFPAHGTIYGLSNLYPKDVKQYVGNAGFVGIDTFQYRITDFLGATSAPTTVTLFVLGDGVNDGVCSGCAQRGGPAAVGEPVNVTNGNMYLQQNDYKLPGVRHSIELTRTYNSNSQRIGLFGRGWATVYDESIISYDSSLVRFNQADGRAIYFSRPVGSSGAFAPLQGDFHAVLTQDANGSTLTLKDGSVRQFNTAGKLISLADRSGNETTLAYDGGGKLTSVTDPFGRLLSFTSNASGRVLSISDTMGTVATYTYGSANQLLSATYADNSRFQFVYNANYRLTSVADALGNILESHTYDAQGRAITSERQGGVERYTLSYASTTRTDVTDALGRVTKYTIDKSKGRNVVTRVEGVCSCGGGGSQVQTWTYDNQLNVTAKTDALNHTNTFTYDANGNRLTETDATGTVTYTYNQFSEVLTRTDQMSGVTTNTYDAQGNLLTTKDSLNNTTTFTHDSHGQPATVTDARGKVTTFTWDSSGRLIQTKDALNNTTNVAYDARARVTAVTNALSQTTSYEYDLAGRPKKTTFPDSNFVSYTYDLAGRRTKITDARGNDTNFAYDSAYRLTSVTDALSHATSHAYDAMSNQTANTDALGRVTNYEYDDFNRLKKVIYPPASTGATRLQETIEYDANGNVKKKTDSAARETTFAYDSVNRMTSSTDAENQITTFQYDALSRRTAVVDALSQQYQFAYDALGRRTAMTRAGVSMSFAYDAVGNRTQRTDYNGVTTNYTYDDLNRLTTIAYPNSTGATYTYDALSRLATAANENGTVSLAYDNRGRIASTTDVFNRTLAYAYDANGNRIAMTVNGSAYAGYSYDVLNQLTELSDSSAVAATYAYDAVTKPTSRTLANGVVSTYEYDGLNRLTRLRDVKGTTSVLDNQYSYNTAQQITGVAELGGTQAYDYDVADRLTSANEGSYTYDVVGNRTSANSIDYSYGAVNRLETSSGGFYYTYDANGNQLTRTMGSSGSTRTYDFENRLTQVALAYPSVTTVDYKYDALGRRIERAPNDGPVQKFVYDGEDVVEDLDDEGNVVASYLNGPGIDNKIRQTDANGNLYFTSDHLGSTRALTDDYGSVVEQIDYDSFGNGSGSSYTRYTYTGREFDAESGLYYYRARFYDSHVGRFISEDPIELNAGINFYAYLGNDPINWMDPYGLCKCGVKKGPEYHPGFTGFNGRGFSLPSGNVVGGGLVDPSKLPAGLPFYWHAEFLNDSAHSPNCCEVRQLISWNRPPFGPNTVPHAGFPASARPGQWLEDRNQYNKRYGRRVGRPYYDPNVPGSYHGNEYDGDDRPNGPPIPGFILRFRLIVVDICRGGRTIYTSKTLSVNF